MISKMRYCIRNTIIVALFNSAGGLLFIYCFNLSQEAHDHTYTEMCLIGYWTVSLYESTRKVEICLAVSAPQLLLRISDV